MVLRLTSRVAIVLAGAALLSACARVGPRSIRHDRIDYSASIAESWKQQTLLNVVKIRYMDLPIFMDVAQIVSSYSLETAVSAGGALSSDGAVQGNSVSLGAAGRFIDRPTITYTPLTGKEFVHALIQPIDPANVFFMLQAGYPADFVLGIAVQSLNGVQNRPIGQARGEDSDPDFKRVLELCRDIQAAGALTLRVVEGAEPGEAVVLTLRRAGLPEEIVAKARELRSILGLSPDAESFRLFYSTAPGKPDELAVHSRSMLQILSALATYIDIPPEHVAEGRAAPAPPPGAAAIRIHSGLEPPEEAYTAVEYRGTWFWVDDRDYVTKRAMTAIMFFFTLMDTGEQQALPLVTIPAS